MRLWIWLPMILLCTLLVNEAQADLDPFEFQIYPYQTGGKGKLDPQLLSSFVPSGFRDGGAGTSADGTIGSQYMARNAAEFEYGLTRKIDFAYYVNVANSPYFDGGVPQYAGSKFRLRGQFFEKDQLPINLGWYSEIEWWGKQFEDNLVEGEIMLIAQKDIGRWTFIVNAPDLDHGFVGADVGKWFSLGYRAEVRYWVSKNMTLALQGYGTSGQLQNPHQMRDQQHYIVPSVHVMLPGEIPANFGIGFGLTPNSDEVIFKTIIYFGGKGSLARDIRLWR
ncbi:MAG TPA: hypothetical protein VFX10_00145 [Nitrospira sp.]|nr:hypothetical protein [Nitrospira sp.]